ncbi:hypothetical protein E2C01_097215 [Portunus trituberculatus]|uniref:Uncharacterized protein n=1 Tax=Portunus trituberculatus TaxID=210409 RepID=A0A5B7K557_PORTR|nr:hypothetical protein [Portunus trituberculatus]
MKVSEVEAEFHRRISEAEFCRVNSATEEVAVPAVSLPSNEMKGVVSSGAKRRKVLRATQRVETENSFAVLEGVEEEKEEAGSDEVRRVEGSLPAGKLLLIVDSQVRHLDAAFYDKDKRRRTRVCLPGAGIERVGFQLDTCLADGTKPIVSLSAGGNDICRVRSEELFRRFKEALAKIRNKDATPVITAGARNGRSLITGSSFMAKTPCMPGMECIYHAKVFEFWLEHLKVS